MTSIAWLILGLVPPAVVAVGWHFLTRPKLEIGDPVLTSCTDPFSHWGIEVRQAALPTFLERLSQRRPAENVQGTLEVYSLDCERLFDYRVRWQGSPQPVTPAVARDGTQRYLPDQSKIGAGERFTVHDGNPEMVDLFVKQEGDPQTYGFSNESYAHFFANPQWVVPAEQAFAKLTVYFGRQSTTAWLQLSNAMGGVDALEVDRLNSEPCDGGDSDSA